jgi:acetoin utilization deacetylase AcuC-like enzyme
LSGISALKICDIWKRLAVSKEEYCMKVFYSPSYTIAAHSFETTRKSRWIAESLSREAIAGVELVAPEPTSAATLSQVHDPEYVDAVRTGNPRQLAQSQGFHWDPALWEMVCSSNGGAVAATIEALHTRRISGSLSSGLHHARRSRGAGFCTFNGLVLGARAALDAGARTVLILDLDAHCGGGTHELIHDDDRIWQMDVSVDAFDRYHPFGNNQLEMVHDSSRYLPTIEGKLTWLEREAPRFDVCLYNAGMDPFEGCRIGGMKGVTQKVLRDREVAVFSWCRMRGIPIAFVLAGGYINPPELEQAGLVALHRLTLEAAYAYGGPRTADQGAAHLVASQAAAPAADRTAEKPYNVLTVRDLIYALGWHTRYNRHGTDNELSDYWHLRFELLSQALALPKGWNEDSRKTPPMLESLAFEIHRGGVFSGWLEYTWLPGEKEIFEAHEPGIHDAEISVRSRIFNFTEELLLTYWPQLHGKSVHLEELVAMGLPANEPDPYDFL